MKSQIIAYGERPITQFVLSLCSKEDLNELIGNIKFKNHDQNNIIKHKSELEKIFIEAPLPKGKEKVGTADVFFQFKDFNLLFEIKPRSIKESLKKSSYLAQIERYHNYIKNPNYSGDLELVKRITKSMKDKKTILICITDDSDFPEELNKIIIDKKWNFEDVGWLPYKLLRDIADKHHYKIFNQTNQHIWIKSTK